MPVTPDNLSSSSTEPTHTIYSSRSQRRRHLAYGGHTSSKSSLAHSGMGVPQYRFREMFQSRAFASQLPNLWSPTFCGTLHTLGQRTATLYTAHTIAHHRVC